MQAIAAGLTFKVAEPQAEVSYAASAGKQVEVKGGSFQASADRVVREADGVSLRLEGGVRLRWERGGGTVELTTAQRAAVNLRTGQVTLDLDVSPEVPVQPCGVESRY
jgi:hypothetical protein